MPKTVVFVEVLGEIIDITVRDVQDRSVAAAMARSSYMKAGVRIQRNISSKMMELGFN
jgi:hypothetical protein